MGRTRLLAGGEVCEEPRDPSASLIIVDDEAVDLSQCLSACGFTDIEDTAL